MSKPSRISPTTGDSSSSIGRRALKRHQMWLVVTVLFVVAGILAAVAVAGSAARTDNDKSKVSFARSAADIAASLRLALLHENDLVVNTGGYLVANPAGTEADFLRWAASVQLQQRYPEVQGVGVLVIVPQAQLAAFAARELADPVQGLIPDASFTLVPPGPRPFYCLTGLAQNRNPETKAPAGLDYCAGVSSAALLGARDSGQGSYTPYQVGTQTWLAVQTPVYTGGAVPATVAARQVQFAGWVGTEVNPAVLLAQALVGHPGISVSMRYAVGSAQAVFASAQSPAGGHSVSINLNDGWTVQASGAVASGGIVTDHAARSILIGGIAFSLLIGVLVFVLGTGRERARRVIEQRTGQLQHQALHDALTGLPNRALVTDRIDQLLARNRRHGTIGAALFIDVDDFKNVNDTLGHQAGDNLLIAVSSRLASTLRDADTIGRMGGDEFVVLFDGVTVDVSPELVAQRLIAVMAQPFDLDGTSMPLIVSISIGIAIGDRSTAGELLRDADVALYQAKTAGKNRYEIFRPEMQTTISRRLDLGFDLRSALADQQFRLVYQPIYNLDDLTVVGVEALLRWDHPRQGLISPDEFIPILEQTGQIREIGRWVLRQACDQMALWHARGDTLDVSVNVSARQLDNDTVVTDIRDALRASGLPATSLIIEVTETALMGNAGATAQRLHSIRQLGVRIAVDDFGTGYSSLAYLRQFPVDCLKIDRMFTNAITTSPESKALIGTLVQLGKDLGLSTLAEGVETTNEMDLLRSAHVDQAQGFLLARPLDPGTLETQLLQPTRPTSPAPDSRS
jgi:diguanylate cyclase (GGDEF)-like protein